MNNNFKFKWVIVFLLMLILALAQFESLNVSRDQIRIIGITVVFIFNFQYWNAFGFWPQTLVLNQINLYFIFNALRLHSTFVLTSIHLIIMYLTFVLFENTYLNVAMSNNFPVCGNIFSFQFPIFKFSSVWNGNTSIIYDKTLYNYSTTSNKANLWCYSLDSSIYTISPSWTESYYNTLQSSSVQPKIINGFDLLLMSLLLITLTVFHVKQLLV